MIAPSQNHKNRCTLKFLKSDRAATIMQLRRPVNMARNVVPNPTFFVQSPSNQRGILLEGSVKLLRVPTVSTAVETTPGTVCEWDVFRCKEGVDEKGQANPNTSLDYEEG